MTITNDALWALIDDDDTPRPVEVVPDLPGRRPSYGLGFAALCLACALLWSALIFLVVVAVTG